MCGIIGYTGSKNAGNIIIDALHSLEYRGYDSAGLSVFTSDNNIRTIRTKGRVADLADKTEKAQLPVSFCGIGHTRWATHGKPSEINAHPHGTENLMIVHNGIIENYKEIKKLLHESGTEFYSDTDTEAAAKLIDLFYCQFKDPIKAIIHATEKFTGSYALGIIFRDIPNTIFATKKDSPLLIGISNNENFIASDASAFIKHTNRYIRAEDGDIIRITSDSVSVIDKNVNQLQREIRIAERTFNDTQKSQFSHFMLKEIFEEPEVLSDTLRKLTKNYMPDFSRYIDSESFFKNINRIHIVACGTAMHAGLIGKYYIERYAGIPVNVEIASEFRYSQPILDKNDLVVIISQSGETADSLAALRLVNRMKIPTLSIVNTTGSSIAEESEFVIYTDAGPEISVASTKAFSVQSLVMMLLALKFAERKMNREDIRNTVKSLHNCITGKLASILYNTDDIQKAAVILSNHKDVFYIGRGCDSYLCQEASLKLKEISYIHSEAYPAGELKHGTISLIDRDTPVVVLVTDEKNVEKIRSNTEEVRSRGAFIISVCSQSNKMIKEISDICITIEHDCIFSQTLTGSTVIQLLAYYTALQLGRDIDKPRNLAKSVTVE